MNVNGNREECSIYITKLSYLGDLLMHDNKHESEIMKTIQISNANVNIYDLS